MAFEKSRMENRLHYVLLGDLTVDLAEKLAADIATETKGDDLISKIVLELRDYQLDPRAFKVFTPLGLMLRKSSRQIYALSVDRSVHALIRSEGMDNILFPINTLSELKGSNASTKDIPKLDVNFINPFVEGTIHVLKVQCSTEISPEKPALKGKEEFSYPTDIAGLIGITSRSFNGSIALCFSQDAFLHIMSRMLDEELSEINDELADGAAELINMIFGHAKKVLNEQGHTIDKALPSVVHGPNLKIDHSGAQDSIILPFKMGDSRFYMEIGLEKI